MSSPLDQNPTSGGEPAKPSATPHEIDADIHETTEMLEGTAIAANDGDSSSEQEDDEVEVEIVEDEEPDFMTMLPQQVRQRVEKLKDFHNARVEIMSDYFMERAALEKKYADLCEPLFAKRRNVVQGNLDDEIEKEAAGEKNPPQALQEEGYDDDENLVGIPQFWVCAMGNMAAIAELISERDVDCLAHLINITCDDFSDGKGFTLSFHFDPNEYFSNTILTKTYEIPNLLLDDEPVLKNVTGCDIQWKDPSRALTHQRITKKQRAKRGKHAGQIRTVTREEQCESFFHFFQPPKLPAMETMNEEEADAIEEIFDQDYEIAQSFRTHLIPKAVMWFTGEALDEDLDLQDLQDLNGDSDIIAEVIDE